MATLCADTDARAEEILVQACREMTPTEKLRRVMELNAAAYGLAQARIRAWYGDLSAHEMNLRLAALRLDRATMIRLFGWDPEEKGY